MVFNLQSDDVYIDRSLSTPATNLRTWDTSTVFKQCSKRGVKSMSREEWCSIFEEWFSSIACHKLFGNDLKKRRRKLSSIFEVIILTPSVTELLHSGRVSVFLLSEYRRNPYEVVHTLFEGLLLYS